MSLKMMGTALAALSLTAGSAAVAQSAAPLSIAGSPVFQRAGADLGEASQLRGPGVWIVGAIALGLIIWGIVELTNNEKDFPTSP